MNNQLKAVSILLRAAHSLEDVLKKDIESYDINTTEFGVLEYLYHKGSQNIQHIGEKLLMANSSMTYVIDKLLQKAYIEKIINQNDKRKSMIQLSDQGKVFFESIFPKHINKVSKVFSILSDDELLQMNELLKKVGYYSKFLSKEGKS